MDVAKILSAIDAEISKLQEARSLLGGFTEPVKRGRGRPKKSVVSTPARAGGRLLSPEARARIAAAQKKRWAVKKSAAKS